MTYSHRYVIQVDGNPFIETNDEALVERTIEVALRRGRNDEVAVEDRETGETSVYRCERRVVVDRRATPRGEDRRAS